MIYYETKNGRRYVAGSGAFEFEPLGIVKYVVRSQAKRFVARWRDGIVHITVPRGVPLEEFRSTLAEMQSRLLATKPSTAAAQGQMKYDFGDFTIELTVYEAMHPLGLQPLRCEGGWIVRLGQGYDPDDARWTKSVNAMIRRIGSVMAPGILLPLADQVSRALGVSPSSWDISNGRKTLGRCDRNGVIALSSNLVFYPDELRRYVIKHELAHLSEFNHSARFHQLCNAYCDGREAELVARLNAYRLPF